jgi:hypothetical protein
VLSNPEARDDKIIPAAIPPVVSIEKDLPGLRLFDSLAKPISFIKVNPETRQIGKSSRKVNIMLTSREGVSPVSKKSPDKMISRNRDTKGLIEKIRLILRMSFKDDLAAIAAPEADAISHEPRNIPLISS